MVSFFSSDEQSPRGNELLAQYQASSVQDRQSPERVPQTQGRRRQDREQEAGLEDRIQDVQL